MPVFNFVPYNSYGGSERFVAVYRLSSCFIFSYGGEINLEECNTYSACDRKESDGLSLRTYVRQSGKKISLRIDGRGGGQNCSSLWAIGLDVCVTLSGIVCT